ncbi:MAG: hypothetical protein HZB38_06470 [Planctomycetes bacterium]|nr:hypothetical protein [Planctomycetota bacterium]
MPYHESDHVLNIAYNALCGGTCLENLELRRNDQACLDALGAQRIPGPTAAGDFCRRFKAAYIATEAPGALGVHVVKLLAYGGAGDLGDAGRPGTGVITGVLCVPAVDLGSWLSTHLLARVSARALGVIMQWMILVAAALFALRAAGM